MTKTQVIDYFGNQSKAAVALGLSKGAVSLWPEDLPVRLQCFIEVVTEGNLKADREKVTSETN